MKARVLKALKGSIRKWVKIEAGTGVDESMENCPLCELFSISCSGCPVEEKTGLDQCIKTPYVRWLTHQLLKHDIIPFSDKPWRVECGICRKLAKEEREFLEKLLPKKGES